MNLAIWDIESSNANTDFGSIIEVGGILIDENFKEKDRFNLRCRLPEGEIPQCMALIVNKTSVDLLTKANLSHYQMLGELEKIFKKQNRSKLDLNKIQNLIKKYNSINSCFKRAEHFVNISYNALNIFNPSREKTILQNLTSYSLERSF